MLDPKLIRQDANAVAERLKCRGFTFELETFQSLEEKRKHFQTRLQELQNSRNSLSKSIGVAIAKGEAVQGIKDEVKKIGEELEQVNHQFENVQHDLNQLLALVPNLPHESVPIGKSEEDNQVVRTWGEPTEFSFQPKDHVELGERLGMDFSAGSKLSGARFVVLHKNLARLHRALIQFMMDLHIQEHGYQEVYVPYIVNRDTLYGTGQLPKLKEDLFSLNGEQDFYLIPTSEPPVTNLVRDEIVDEAVLPIKYVCHSPCFRSEAGSYGKDTRGMIRQHQFEKVELVQIVHPAHSYEALEQLTQHAENVLKRLELPYRVMALCTADLGFYSAKTYDLEVWLPGQGKYREISSCSNTESFQARRMLARYRESATNKTELLHTLNGSGLAVGRTMVAIIENYQDEQGRIHIPAALQSYYKGTVIEN